MPVPESLFSVELESQLLSGLLKHGGEFFRIQPYIAPDVDFASHLKNIHKKIYYAIESLAEEEKEIDPVLVTEQVNVGGMSFPELDDLTPQLYVESLLLRQISAKAVLDVARALKLKTFQRQRWMAAARMAKALEKEKFDNADQIVNRCDQLYTSGNEYWNGKVQEPVNLLENLEALVKERGDNPPPQLGLLGPHKCINHIFGSLLRPGNLTVIGARSGGHKTSFSMDYCFRVMDKNEVPVLHLDNGEMSEDEISWRMAASLSGLPMGLIESGDYRRSKEAMDKLDKVWPRVRELEKIGYYFYNVGGMTTEQQLAAVQKFYLSKVGRDQVDKMACVFDYLKIGGIGGNKQEYILFHEAMIKWKNFVRKTCPIGVLMPVQVNRSGIVGNKKMNEVVSDAGIIAGSDGITFNASHVFVLEKKTFEQLAMEEKRFGNYRLVSIKSRFLGLGAQEQLTPLKMPGSSDLVNNWINFDIDNFSAKEMGTGREVVKFMEGKLSTTKEDMNSGEISL